MSTTLIYQTCQGWNVSSNCQTAAGQKEAKRQISSTNCIRFSVFFDCPSDETKARVTGHVEEKGSMQSTHPVLPSNRALADVFGLPRQLLKHRRKKFSVWSGATLTPSATNKHKHTANRQHESDLTAEVLAGEPVTLLHRSRSGWSSGPLLRECYVATRFLCSWFSGFWQTLSQTQRHIIRQQDFSSTFSRQGSMFVQYFSPYHREVSAAGQQAQT